MKNFYCVICGSELEDRGHTCSNKCHLALMDFKGSYKEYLPNGYCNFCGKPHSLTKNLSHKNMILLRHPECYSSSFAKQFCDKNKVAKVMTKDIDTNKEFRLASGEKVYDTLTGLLMCPKCKNYSLEYNDWKKEWICKLCGTNSNKSLIINWYAFNLKDNDKYMIYKNHGIEALSEITKKPVGKIELFISSYFENCCTSKGEKCPYHTFFDVPDNYEAAKISHLFYDMRNKYVRLLTATNMLKHGIKESEKRFKINDLIILEFFKSELEELYETILQSINRMHDYMIGFADDDIIRNQCVYYSEINPNIIYVTGKEENACYAWNDAIKGQLVGVFGLPISAIMDFAHSITETYMAFQLFLEKQPHAKLKSEKIEPIEKKVLNLIKSEKGIYQMDVWRTLGMDYRECSRIVTKLLSKNLIKREKAPSNVLATYKLLPKSTIHKSESAEDFLKQYYVELDDLINYDFKEPELWYWTFKESYDQDIVFTNFGNPDLQYKKDMQEFVESLQKEKLPFEILESLHISSRVVKINNITYYEITNEDLIEIYEEDGYFIDMIHANIIIN